ncbi:MAG: YbjN domain-containing protein [Acidimicrobiales bacterium]
MERFPIADADAATRLDERLGEWARAWTGEGHAVAIDHHAEADPAGHFHWLVRLRGEEKDVVTVWISLRQRSVHVETEVIPAPEMGEEALYRYALVRNADLRSVHLAIGPESAIYLVTALPLAELNLDRLDEIMAAVLIYVDELYPTMMTLGFAWYRRRRR